MLEPYVTFAVFEQGVIVSVYLAEPDRNGPIAVRRSPSERFDENEYKLLPG